MWTAAPSTWTCDTHTHTHSYTYTDAYTQTQVALRNEDKWAVCGCGCVRLPGRPLGMCSSTGAWSQACMRTLSTCAAHRLHAHLPSNRKQPACVNPGLKTKQTCVCVCVCVSHRTASTPQSRGMPLHVATLANTTSSNTCVYRTRHKQCSKLHADHAFSNTRVCNR